MGVVGRSHLRGPVLCERRSGSLQICILAVVWALLSLTLFPERFYGYPYEMVIHGFSALLRIRMFGSPIFTASCLILVTPRNSS